MHGVDPFFASKATGGATGGATVETFGGATVGAFGAISDDEPIEYFDANNRRLLVSSKIMPSDRGLWRRTIGVILYDMRRRVYVCRRKTTHEGSTNLWDIFATGFVHLGESSEDAALRHVQHTMDEPAELKPILGMAYEPCSWFVSLYALGPTHAKPSSSSSIVGQFSGQFMDRHELKALYEYAPELCTPLLSWCFTSHVLWRVSD